MLNIRLPLEIATCPPTLALAHPFPFFQTTLSTSLRLKRGPLENFAAFVLLRLRLRSSPQHPLRIRPDRPSYLADLWWWRQLRRPVHQRLHRALQPHRQRHLHRRALRPVRQLRGHQLEHLPPARRLHRPWPLLPDPGRSRHRNLRQPAHARRNDSWHQLQSFRHNGQGRPR